MVIKTITICQIIFGVLLIVSICFVKNANLYASETTMAHGWSYNHEDSLTAITEALDKLKVDLEANKPSIIFLSLTTMKYNAHLMLNEIQKAFKNVPVWGASSALGIIMNNEFEYMKGNVVGLVALCTNDYHFFVEGEAIQTFGNKYLNAAKHIINKAKKSFPDKIPQLILFTGTPGPHEEIIIELLKKKFGRKILIYGGSAGTEKPYKRYAIANSKAISKGLSLAFIYTSKKIGHCYQMGYKSLQKRGIATRVAGRWLYEIDGKPALNVYNEWADGFFTKSIEEGKNIRGAGQMYHPLAMIKKNDQGKGLTISLSAKQYSKKTGAIEFFASVEKGDVLTILKGDTNSLVNRAYLAVAKANRMIKGNLAGGLAFYCSGARLLLEKQGRTSELGPKLKRAFKDKPFILMFNNGEHGNMQNCESFHGNLMLDVVVFEK